jgi:hypothetical protein
MTPVTLDSLRRHWGRAYEFTATDDGRVTAEPRHPWNTPLDAATPADLLALIHRDYRSPPHGQSASC